MYTLQQRIIVADNRA